jgi:hypothetical protein
MTRRPWRLVAALVLLFAATVVAADRLAPEPGGPEGSSYATAPEGAAAYADLLQRAGHRVSRLRTPLAERPPDPGATLVLLDAERIAPGEARAIARFVAAGGRLVAGGGPAPWLGRVLAEPPVWSPSRPGRATVVVPVSETADVGTVAMRGGGRWARPGGTLPLLASPAGVVAAAARRGRGRAILLADASPLHNRWLGSDDDAAFGLAVAGGSRRPVAFLETVHGYGRESGLAALPANALWAIAGLALAAIALVWSMCRRLGPPEDEARALAPPRRDFVAAVADALGAAADDRGIAEAAARAARRRLAARAGLHAAAGTDALREAAARCGLDEAETAAVLATGEIDALAAGRALARLGGRTTMTAPDEGG